MNGLKNKIKNEIVATKVDKGNATVLLTKNEYVCNDEKLMRENPHKEISYNYTGTFQGMVEVNEGSNFC